MMFYFNLKQLWGAFWLLFRNNYQYHGLHSYSLSDVYVAILNFIKPACGLFLSKTNDVTINWGNQQGLRNIENQEMLDAHSVSQSVFQKKS